MNRGAARQAIFANDEHRRLFLKGLSEAWEMFGIEIHAYCLMGNHYHLLIRTPNANLSRAMRHINGVYTQRFNRAVGTDGPLFRGRYKAQLVDEDSYLLLVSRYIHLNPVVANIVEKPAKYRWSSYKAYLLKEPKPNWLTIDFILQHVLKRKSLSHVKNYHDYVEIHDLDEVRTLASTKFTSPILGDEAFKIQAMKAVKTQVKKDCGPDINRVSSVPTVAKIKKATADYYQITPKTMQHSKKGKINFPKLISIYIARRKYGHSLIDIAKAFAPLSHVTIGTTVCKCEKQFKQYPERVDDMEKIVANLQG